MHFETFTAAEYEEIRLRPLQSAFTVFTPEQLTVRKNIARKVCISFDTTARNENQSEWTTGFDTHPRWKFYNSESGPRRVYGYLFDPDNNRLTGLHAVTARAGWVNDVVGGVSVDSVTEVENWTDVQIARLTASVLFAIPCPGMFIDPLGFLLAMFDEPGHARVALSVAMRGLLG
jgi:hypothetical protein